MTNEEQKLKSEFVKMGMEVSLTNEVMSFEEIADYWLKKIAESREKMIESIEKIKIPIEGVNDGRIIRSYQSYNEAIDEVLNIIKNKEDSK